MGGVVRCNADEWLQQKNTDKSDELYYDFCVECNDFANIFTPHVNDLIMRHKWLKDYHVYSYGSQLDDLPGYFVDAVNIIEANIMQALESKRK